MMTECRRRSTRFPLEFPALLRWHVGRLMHTVRTKTKNISRSGLYLQLQNDHKPNSRIEFEVELPPSPTAETGALLRGKGRLIRREDLGNQVSGFAAVIDRYEFITTTPTVTPDIPGETKPADPAPAERTSSKKSASRRAAARA